MLPTNILAALASHGFSVCGVAAVAGGEISQTFRIETDGGSFFLKVQPGPNAVPFTAERIGLETLRQAGAIRIPNVIVEGSGTEGAYLVLENIVDGPPRDPAAFRDRFARELAALHRIRPADGEGYGFPSDNYIGHFVQANWLRSMKWADFYRFCRIFPQMERARTWPGILYELDHPLRKLLAALVHRIPEILDGMPEEPSLIHGDLWRGNFLCAPGDEPVLIDPAAYYGHREVEMAFIELFGGFPPGFVATYQKVWPLDEGYTRRRSLHQLYPLLVHLNHFGEKYAPAVERVCREYVGEG
jgi:fructosamine-3-kinase